MDNDIRQKVLEIVNQLTGGNYENLNSVPVETLQRVKEILEIAKSAEIIRQGFDFTFPTLDDGACQQLEAMLDDVQPTLPGFFPFLKKDFKE